MKNKELITKTVFLLMLHFVANTASKAQGYSRMIDKADTVNFSIPKGTDWQLLNSYVGMNKAEDSVLLELIVLNEKKNIVWGKDQYIGQIKNKKFISKTDRVAWCYLINTVYKVKVDSNGKCYFNLEKGTPPTKFPAVLPLKIRYKL